VGKSQRRKGHNAEREVVRLAEGQGLIARRSWASQKPDVVIQGKPVSVKRRRNGMRWAYEELKDHDYVLFRADGKPWLKISKWGCNHN